VNYYGPNISFYFQYGSQCFKLKTAWWPSGSVIGLVDKNVAVRIPGTDDFFYYYLSSYFFPIIYFAFVSKYSCDKIVLCVRLFIKHNGQILRMDLDPTLIYSASDSAHPG
jgi:hypothetical protein